MLSVIGAASQRPHSSMPSAARDRALPSRLALPAPLAEADALAELKRLAAKNDLRRASSGQGYPAPHTPGVILRNILENPAWYTAYTPYQAEISQAGWKRWSTSRPWSAISPRWRVRDASMLDEATPPPRR